MVNSVSTAKIVRKRTKKFHRHQADRFMRVDASWRKPIGKFHGKVRHFCSPWNADLYRIIIYMCFIGIDSRVRRRFKGQYLMPSIGYGTKASDRHRCSVRRLVLLRNTVLYVLLLTLYRNTVFQIRSKLEIILGPKKLQKICCQQCCWIGSSYDEQSRFLCWNRPRSFCQEEKDYCWTCWTTRYPRH